MSAADMIRDRAALADSLMAMTPTMNAELLWQATTVTYDRGVMMVHLLIAEIRCGWPWPAVPIRSTTS
jgi:hypothetical protein